jgi:chitin synthase
MRFVIFIDLFSTVVQPAGLIYVVYLTYSLVVNSEVFPLVSVVMLSCAYGLQMLIFIAKREWAMIGWMIVYIIAMPVFGFMIPLYAFWHMDCFEWGSTRRVAEDESDDEDVTRY